MSDGLQQYLDSIVARLPEQQRRKFSEDNARKARLANELRRNCGVALVHIGDAIQYPNIARADLEAAHTAIAKALSVAAALDPE